MDDGATSLQLAEKAHVFREREQWADAAHCYEQILQLNILPEDRAKTYANLMQMYEKQGKIEEAAGAALSAYETIQEHRIYRTNEGARMRGIVRGFLMKLRDDHLGSERLKDPKLTESLLHITDPKIIVTHMIITSDPMFPFWCALTVAWAFCISLYYVGQKHINFRLEHPTFTPLFILSFILFLILTVLRYILLWHIAKDSTSTKLMLERSLLFILLAIGTITSIYIIYTLTIFLRQS